MNSDENVEALSRAILGDVQAESDQVKTEAQLNVDGIKQRAQAQAEAERKAILEQASQEAERIRSQAIATAQLKARALELENREKLLDKVFKTVRQQLPGIHERNDYSQIVLQLVREAVNQLNATKADIHVDNSTQKILTGPVLEKISKEMKAELSIGSPVDKGIGVIVDASNGHLHYDNTFDTRLTRLQNGLRSSVYRLLIGESA
jgi:vacuolar-type H+-ATPase subunit E/Vma4